MDDEKEGILFAEWRILPNGKIKFIVHADMLSLNERANRQAVWCGRCLGLDIEEDN